MNFYTPVLLGGLLGNSLEERSLSKSGFLLRFSFHTQQPIVEDFNLLLIFHHYLLPMYILTAHLSAFALSNSLLCLISFR